jgi:hypothetical protein
MTIETTPQTAGEKQRAYRLKRRRWAHAIGRPYSLDLDKPEPGELPINDEQEG